MLRGLRVAKHLSSMTRSPPRAPLIAVIGATGTGKSQLAVSLAKRYDGEIINGDAMQLYAGLPIITNKIPVEERLDVAHHLLGCIGLHEQTWVVGTFVKEALRVIDEIRSRGKLPILVGGTHYYTQSLLFLDRLADESDTVEPEFVTDTTERWPILQQPTEVLLEELKRVDPVMADRWHPNDRRKIQRSLEVYLQTGKTASRIYAEQRERNYESTSGLNGGDHSSSEQAGLRFPTLILWVHADNEVLRKRLSERVDIMFGQGLIDEVKLLNSFAKGEAAEGRAVDETRGIWVSIGYKEFKAYAQALEELDVSDTQLSKLRLEALERTKIATRQYAKRQLRWIRIKLVNALAQANRSDHLYLLDGTHVASFEQDVVAPACELAGAFLSAAPMPEAASLSNTAADMLVPKRDYDFSATPEKWSKQHCEACGVTCVTEEQWSMHLKSKGHRKAIGKTKRAQDLDEVHASSGVH